MGKNKKIGALWKRKMDKGDMLTGEIEINGEKVRICIWPNGFKEADKQPDFIIYHDTYHADNSTV